MFLVLIHLNRVITMVTVLVRGRKTDINRHCPGSYKLNEIFNGSIIRISYRCSKNITKTKDIKNSSQTTKNTNCTVTVESKKNVLSREVVK